MSEGHSSRGDILGSQSSELFPSSQSHLLQMESSVMMERTGVMPSAVATTTTKPKTKDNAKKKGKRTRQSYDPTTISDHTMRQKANYEETRAEARRHENNFGQLDLSSFRVVDPEFVQNVHDARLQAGSHVTAADANRQMTNLDARKESSVIAKAQHETVVNHINSTAIEEWLDKMEVSFMIKEVTEEYKNAPEFPPGLADVDPENFWAMHRFKRQTWSSVQEEESQISQGQRGTNVKPPRKRLTSEDGTESSALHPLQMDDDLSTLLRNTKGVNEQIVVDVQRAMGNRGPIFVRNEQVTELRPMDRMCTFLPPVTRNNHHMITNIFRALLELPEDQEVLCIPNVDTIRNAHRTTQLNVFLMQLFLDSISNQMLKSTVVSIQKRIDKLRHVALSSLNLALMYRDHCVALSPYNGQIRTVG